jgi:ESCRT-II complex subunit VPS25
VLIGRLQPVRATREKQLVLWKQLILEYHRTHALPLLQPLASTLFENVKISRNMAPEGRLAVVEYIIRSGNGAWEDDAHTRCRVMWKKPAEWATEIYDFVREASEGEGWQERIADRCVRVVRRRRSAG